MHLWCQIIRTLNASASTNELCRDSGIEAVHCKDCSDKGPRLALEEVDHAAHMTVDRTTAAAADHNLVEVVVEGED